MKPNKDRRGGRGEAESNDRNRLVLTKTKKEKGSYVNPAIIKTNQPILSIIRKFEAVHRLMLNTSPCARKPLLLIKSKGSSPHPYKSPFHPPMSSLS